MNTDDMYLPGGSREPLGRSTLPFALGTLDLFLGLLVNANYVIVGEDLAIDHRLFRESLSLIELSSQISLLGGPFLLSSLSIVSGGPRN